MKIENESILMIASKAKSEQRWDQATRAVVGLSVCACLFFTPRVAQAFSLTSLITYVTNIANVESQLSGSQSSMSNFNSDVVVPALQLTSLKSWLSLAETSYQGWFNAVLRVPVSSASMTNTSSLETAMRAGYSGGTGSSIASNYSGVYGARLTTTQASSQIASQVDMSDTTAQEGLALAANSDNASSKLITTAQNLQQQAATTAPGTADMIAAQSQALQLQSNSMMHHVLASILREEAMKIASEAAEVKQQNTNHTKAMQTFGGQQ